MKGRDRAVFPRRLAAPAGALGPFERVDDVYALYDRGPQAPMRGAVLVLERGRIAVFRGDIATARGKAGAVYATPGGALAVPTGRVFVRFRAPVSAEQRRADLESAGYRIERVPAYAPRAAWVRAADETIAAALNGLARLRALADVENVEPEMLTRKQARE